ncbi:hypothetical protein GMMP15_730063 [Candidatus Magnetomoraceae bacterium gMMP-15]
MLKQEVIYMLDSLSNDQLKNILDYIKHKFFQQEKVIKTKLNEEQQELLELLDYGIDSGRGDFAEKHDHYLYGIAK